MAIRDSKILKFIAVCIICILIISAIGFGIEYLTNN
jgi:hypothetical protein